MNHPKHVHEELQRKYGLRVLRIYMDNTTKDKPLAVFTLLDPDGREAGVLTASLPELGFDPNAREEASASLVLPAVYRIPRHIVAAVRSWLTLDQTAAQPLWLRLSVPLGLLPAVPWEELLQPALGVPILRLPYQSICPRQPPSGSNTVVCFCSPVQEPALQACVDAFAAQVPLDLAQATRFHLFGDRAVYPTLLALQRKHAGAVRIDVHDPACAPNPDASPLCNPWLLWIAAEIGKGRADAVHFLCHSDHHAEFGALKMASQPTDGPDSRQPCLAEAADLIDFLDHVGAWCAAFTSTPMEQSAAGMHMLQNEIARFRPGPLLVHNMNVAGSAAALADAYRFLFSPDKRPPASPAVSLYCHPVLVSQWDIDEESDRQLRKFTLDGRLGEKLHDERLPGHILSSQRKLEVSAGALAEAQAQDRNSGRVRARALVLDVLAKYVNGLAHNRRGEK